MVVSIFKVFLKLSPSKLGVTMGSVYIRYHKLNVFFNGGWFNHTPEISLLLTSPTRTKTECLVVKPVFHGKTRLGWMAKVGKIWATKPPAHRLDIFSYTCKYEKQTLHNMNAFLFAYIM